MSLALSVYCPTLMHLFFVTCPNSTFHYCHEDSLFVSRLRVFKTLAACVLNCKNSLGKKMCVSTPALPRNWYLLASLISSQGWQILMKIWIQNVNALLYNIQGVPQVLERFREAISQEPLGLYRYGISAKRFVSSLSFVWQCKNIDYLNFPMSYGRYAKKSVSAFFWAPEIARLQVCEITSRDPLRVQKWHWWHIKRLIL
jgi:hypothetical protein